MIPPKMPPVAPPAMPPAMPPTTPPAIVVGGGRQCPPFEILSVEHGYRLGCIGLGRHFDKPKPTRPTRLAVLHQIDRSDRPSLREQILQVLLGGVIGQIPDV